MGKPNVDSNHCSEFRGLSGQRAGEDMREKRRGD